MDNGNGHYHVLKINLARRHLNPLRWGQVFSRLLEERGVATGQGSSAAKRADSQSARIADIAAEVGVPVRTARHRVSVGNVVCGLATGLSKAG